MTNQVEYTASGSVSVFPFPFAIHSDADCVVLIGGVVQSGDYSVRGQGSIDGGAVVFDSAPVAGSVITIRYRGQMAVSAADAEGGYLADKLVAGTGITVATVTEAGGVQKVVITGTDISGVLVAANNLDDVPNKSLARSKLGVYSTAEADAAIATKVANTALQQLSNLSDLTNKPLARTNLGLDQVAYLNVAQDWTAPQRSQAVQTASVGGSTVLDLAQVQNFNLTLTADITFANPTITAAMVGQKGAIGITPAGFAIADMGTQWKRVGATGSPDVITGIGRIDYHIRALDRVEYAYNDVEA